MRLHIILINLSYFASHPIPSHPLKTKEKDERDGTWFCKTIFWCKYLVIFWRSLDELSFTASLANYYKWMTGKYAEKCFTMNQNRNYKSIGLSFCLSVCLSYVALVGWKNCDQHQYLRKHSWVNIYHIVGEFETLWLVILFMHFFHSLSFSAAHFGQFPFSRYIWILLAMRIV